ncbi:MAG: hypothetical protein V7K98_17780 [Nostoc sp.]
MIVQSLKYYNGHLLGRSSTQATRTRSHFINTPYKIGRSHYEQKLAA